MTNFWILKCFVSAGIEKMFSYNQYLFTTTLLFYLQKVADIVLSNLKIDSIFL